MMAQATGDIGPVRPLTDGNDNENSETDDTSFSGTGRLQQP
jgi:hypothetical protein